MFTVSNIYTLNSSLLFSLLFIIALNLQTWIYTEKTCIQLDLYSHSFLNKNIISKTENLKLEFIIYFSVYH